MALRSQAIKELVKKCVEAAGLYDRTLLSNVKLVAADHGKVSVEFKVEEHHTNRYHNLHGGMTSTLVDSITSIALVTAQKPFGVSVDLNLSFLSGAKLGETLLVEAQVDKAGKNLAYLSALIRSKDSGRIVAKGSHTKYINLPTEPPLEKPSS